MKGKGNIHIQITQRAQTYPKTSCLRLELKFQVQSPTRDQAEK